MSNKKNLLIVEDNLINREVLKEILAHRYSIVEANNGEEALEVLKYQSESVLAVLTDIVMPKINGFQLIEAMKNDPKLNNIPVIAMTACNDNDEEIEALKKGAWDFVNKPVNGELVITRLENAIAKSQVELAKQVAYLVRRDEMTGIFNKRYFLKETNDMLEDNRDKDFVCVYFHIDRFQLINSFYSETEGDRLIEYIADYLIDNFRNADLVKFGRVGNASFAIVMEYEKKKTIDFMENFRNALNSYEKDYDIESYFGLCTSHKYDKTADTMLRNAIIAARFNDHNYFNYYAFYTDEMNERIIREQYIINDMQGALDNEEFKVYLQPKYNIHNNKISGAEALVRWEHPVTGMISPSEFIPIFEQKGFITKLDYYMWEQVCKLIRKWKEEGKKIKPISVNLSRVNIYNSKVVESLVNLVNKYDIEPKYLELELTESAYMDKPEAVINIVKQLREKGFIILMDDFGSGYSSLSILKDIEVDVLKIDLGFLSDENDSGRGENIIASIIRMAKWLKIPVIVEGVERESQVKFLRTIGADFVQGFYYARPISVGDFESLINADRVFDKGNPLSFKDDFDMDTLFQSNPQMEVLFGDLLQALVIIEFDGESMEFVRINEGYYDLFGSEDTAIKIGTPLPLIADEYKKKVIDTFKLAVSMKGTAECDFIRKKVDGTSIWLNVKLRYIRDVGDNALVLALLNDVTARKKIDFEMEKYRKAVAREKTDENVMLVVDDMAPNRAILNKIFQDSYTIIEASDGMEAMEVLKENPDISVVLLDIIMPRMNGWEFLEHKVKDENIANVPVIIITSEDKYDEQMNALDLGIKDYIIKPFVPDIVRKRVENVMDSLHFMDEIMKKYEAVSQLSKIDKMTGLYNRDCAEEMINEHLAGFNGGKDAMIILEVVDFDSIYEKLGSVYGDTLVKQMGRLIKELFRGDDIAFRFSGNIFGVFAKDFKNEEMLKDRCWKYIESIGKEVGADGENLICSVGIAYAPISGKNFNELYDKADEALCSGKSKHKSACTIYNNK